jgi:hypothetical protein
MALTYEELNSITNDYFAIQGKKAVDIYFYTSWLMMFLMQRQGGLWERPTGGEKIRVPLEYDEQVSGFYVRGDTISSDDRESVNAAYFDWKHCYSNATVYRIDGLKNAGDYAKVQLVTQRVGGAQKTVRKTLAGSIYDDHGGAGSRLTGLRACCSETAGTAYGGIAENDLVANDGTKPWEGKTTTTTENLTLNVIRTQASNAKVRDGVNGKPDLYVTTETLWNVVSDILQVQQRFTDQKSAAAKAGFTALWFEGKDVVADDFCPSGYSFALNSAHIGFAVHASGYFVREAWGKIPDSPGDKAMKIYWDGEMIVDNRKAHQAHSNLS